MFMHMPMRMCTHRLSLIGFFVGGRLCGGMVAGLLSSRGAVSRRLRHLGARWAAYTGVGVEEKQWGDEFGEGAYRSPTRQGALPPEGRAGAPSMRQWPGKGSQTQAAASGARRDQEVFFFLLAGRTSGTVGRPAKMYGWHIELGAVVAGGRGDWLRQGGWVGCIVVWRWRQEAEMAWRYRRKRGRGRRGGDRVVISGTWDEGAGVLGGGSCGAGALGQYRVRLN